MGTCAYIKRLWCDDLECSTFGCKAKAKHLREVSSLPPDSQVPSNEPERTAQVLRFSGITKHDLPADRVLQGALDEGLKCAVVLGYSADGEEYFASSIADGADVLWLLERLKLRLLTVEVPEERGG